jgi:hypothetical protein
MGSNHENRRKENNINRKTLLDRRSFNKSTPQAGTDYVKKNSKGVPTLSDEDVELAKEFVEENEK